MIYRVVATSERQRRPHPQSAGPFKTLIPALVGVFLDDSFVLGIEQSAENLSVEPDSAYEAWTVTRADGMMVVCMPGGTLAVWDAES